MKTNPFLKKLFKQKVIALVEPSEAIKEGYIKKSESYLDSAKILLVQGKFEESVSMSYYSMYYMLLAALFKSGIKSENHAGSIILLKEIFDFPNDKIQFAKKERVDKQYYIDFSILEKDAEELIKLAELFNSELLDFISKITNDKVKKFRNKLSETTKWTKKRWLY